MMPSIIDVKMSPRRIDWNLLPQKF
jgi:hypothetical protein